MAHLAILRETRGCVIRIGGGLIFFRVTGKTGGGQSSVLPIAVAGSASGVGMLAGQRKFRQIVIELGAQPVGRGMA